MESGPARSGEIREKDRWDPRQVGWKSINVNAIRWASPLTESQCACVEEVGAKLNQIIMSYE